MLLIIELFFLVTGIWTVISAKPPARMFKLLFGKGQYDLDPQRARLFGLFLASPLPLAFLVAFILSALQGERAAAPAAYFEAFYTLAVAIASIVIARKIRRAS
jgi:hypothetical protein